MKLPEKKEETSIVQFALDRGIIKGADQELYNLVQDITDNFRTRKPAMICLPASLKVGCIQKVIIYPHMFTTTLFHDKTPYLVYEAVSMGLEYKGAYLFCGQPLDFMIPLMSWSRMLDRVGLLKYFSQKKLHEDKAIELHFVKKNTYDYECRYCAILTYTHEIQSHPDQKKFTTIKELYNPKAK